MQRQSKRSRLLFGAGKMGPIAREIIRIEPARAYMAEQHRQTGHFDHFDRYDMVTMKARDPETAPHFTKGHCSGDHGAHVVHIRMVRSILSLMNPYFGPFRSVAVTSE